MLEFIGRHLWAFILLIIIIDRYHTNYIFKKRGYPEPELKQSYIYSLKMYFIIITIPILIMGVGDITGMVYYSIDFFKIGSINIVSILFHAYIIFIFFLFIWWVYFRNGAEYIEKHNSLWDTLFPIYYYTSSNSRQYKVFIIPLWLIIVTGLYIFLWIIGIKMEG